MYIQLTPLVALTRSSGMNLLPCWWVSNGFPFPAAQHTARGEEGGGVRGVRVDGRRDSFEFCMSHSLKRILFFSPSVTERVSQSVRTFIRTHKPHAQGHFVSGARELWATGWFVCFHSSASEREAGVGAELKPGGRVVAFPTGLTCGLTSNLSPICVHKRVSIEKNLQKHTHSHLESTGTRFVGMCWSVRQSFRNAFE